MIESSKGFQCLKSALRAQAGDVCNDLTLITSDIYNYAYTKTIHYEIFSRVIEKELYGKTSVTEFVSSSTPSMDAARSVEELRARAFECLLAQSSQLARGNYYVEDGVFFKDSKKFYSIEKCYRCSGRGSLTCNACGGGTQIACMSCSGSGSSQCSPCYGTGTVSCPKCHGNGSIREAVYKSVPENVWIESKGQYETNYVSQQVWEDRPCSCSYGKVTCSNCHGQRNTRCNSCYGSGKVTCQSCSGAGSVSCSACNGTGAKGQICYGVYESTHKASQFLELNAPAVLAVKLDDPVLFESYLDNDLRFKSIQNKSSASFDVLYEGVICVEELSVSFFGKQYKLVFLPNKNIMIDDASIFDTYLMSKADSADVRIGEIVRGECDVDISDLLTLAKGLLQIPANAAVLHAQESSEIVGVSKIYRNEILKLFSSLATLICFKMAARTGIFATLFTIFVSVLLKSISVDRYAIYQSFSFLAVVMLYNLWCVQVLNNVVGSKDAIAMAKTFYRGRVWVFAYLVLFASVMMPAYLISFLP